MDTYIGQTLGAYQILEQVGQGGMATIYKAYQPAIDRYVAVKVLPAHFTQDETFVARFVQEARTLARLEHPHILPIHDYGEQEGTTYLVMRYIEAGTLKDLVTAEGPLALDQAARILRQIGGALDYAHSQGVIHRDIKPSNVLIDARGDVFLTDFGIAKLVANTAQYTASGAIVGTPAYMSPEQGMADTVDHRSDIYALGVVLYEMVTGHVPYEAETPLAVLLKHVNAPLPLPRQVKADLPEAVERVILKAMAKAPADRFQTVEAMVQAFEKAIAGGPVPETRPSTEAALAAVVPPGQISGPAEQPVTTPTPLPADLASAPAAPTFPWFRLVGTLAALVVFIAAVAFILVNLGDEEAETPTARKSSAERDLIAHTAPGWTNFSNGNAIQALARQYGYLWAGGSGGLVRWDLADGSYVKYGVLEGLPSNQINDLLVDESGTLWVATDAGVSVLTPSADAAGAWRTYDETDGLDSQWVQSLYIDDAGTLWAGTSYGEHGLNRYDGEGWGAPPVPPLPFDHPKVVAFAPDVQGGMFVGLSENGLAHWDGTAWQVFAEKDGLTGDQVHDLLLADDGTLWISVDREVVRWDVETGDWETVPQFSRVEVQRMLQARDGRLWFVGDEGATRYDPQAQDWQQFAAGTRAIPSWQVTAIIEDEDQIWLGTRDGGVVAYDGTAWETWATDDGLGGNWIEAIRQDGSGGIWFMHGGSGLSRYDPVSDAWQTFDMASFWPSVPGIDSQGHVWVGDYGELRKYDGLSWQSFTPAALDGKSVLRIDLGPDDVRWLETVNGLMRYDPAADEWQTFTPEDHPVLENISAMTVARDGALWLGGKGHLVRFDGQTWHTPAAVRELTGYVTDIAQAADGSLWAIASGDLHHLASDEEQWERYNWPGPFWLECLAIGPDGSVWVGHDGLGRFDPATQAWETFTPADGLINESVTAIHVTPEGVVWAGTTNGVSRYVPGE